MTTEPLTRSINREIAELLKNDREFRDDYIRTWAANDIASELRRLRKYRRKRQGDLAKLVNTGQSAISRIEKAAYDGWTYKTLLTIAQALRARLTIRLEPIEDVVRQLTGEIEVRIIATSTEGPTVPAEEDETVASSLSTVWSVNGTEPSTLTAFQATTPAPTVM